MVPVVLPPEGLWALPGGQACNGWGALAHPLCPLATLHFLFPIPLQAGAGATQGSYKGLALRMFAGLTWLFLSATERSSGPEE